MTAEQFQVCIDALECYIKTLQTTKKMEGVNTADIDVEIKIAKETYEMLKRAKDWE